MNIKGLDHLVITTQDLKACLHFYGDVLGMTVKENNGRYALHFGNQKFNIHTKKAEFLPAAQYPTYGSLDLCLVVAGTIDAVVADITAKGYPIELGPVNRNGARGSMQSVYLRDGDGNLVELCCYDEA